MTRIAQWEYAQQPVIMKVVDQLYARTTESVQASAGLAQAYAGKESAMVPQGVRPAWKRELAEWV